MCRIASLELLWLHMQLADHRHEKWHLSAYLRLFCWTHLKILLYRIIRPRTLVHVESVLGLELSMISSARIGTRKGYLVGNRRTFNHVPRYIDDEHRALLTATLMFLKMIGRLRKFNEALGAKVSGLTLQIDANNRKVKIVKIDENRKSLTPYYSPFPPTNLFHISKAPNTTPQDFSVSQTEVKRRQLCRQFRNHSALFVLCQSSAIRDRNTKGSVGASPGIVSTWKHILSSQTSCMSQSFSSACSTVAMIP